MRVIGHLTTEESARRFGDYLFVQGIDNQVECQKNDGWAIWVTDEDKLQSAAELLSAFRENPTAPQYQLPARKATALREEQAREDAAYQKKVHDRRDVFRSTDGFGFGPLTFGLIVVSVLVYILITVGSRSQWLTMLSITNHSTVYNGDFSLPEIRHGQVWRLITPIFLHFGILHILFNMLWLKDLGSMIESRQGPGYLALLVLVVAAFSNVAQFYFSHTPAFGGMSGVVYGLLGYIWMRGKFDPGSGLFLHPSTVTMMLIWLVVCYTGLMGPVANTAHTVGLALGMAWGYLASLLHR